jgi:hypothetical protein
MSDQDTRGIRTFSDERSSWRVMVETWPERDGYHGRFVFEQSRSPTLPDRCEGPDALRGDTREEVIAEAYSLPDERLRKVLRSLA